MCPYKTLQLRTIDVKVELYSRLYNRLLHKGGHVIRWCFALWEVDLSQSTIMASPTLVDLHLKDMCLHWLLGSLIANIRFLSYNKSRWLSKQITISIDRRWLYFHGNRWYHCDGINFPDILITCVNNINSSNTRAKNTYSMLKCEAT